MKTHLLRSILVLFISVNMFSNLNEAKADVGWFSDFVNINANGTGSAYYWIGADPSFGTQFDAHDFGTVSSLVIDGADFKYWSDTQDRAGGAFYYEISGGGFNEVIWTQTGPTGNDYQGTWTESIDLLAGLTAGETYTLAIWAKSWDGGGGQGDSYLSNGGDNYVATFRVENPNVWNGSTDSNWNDAENWSNGLPTLTHDVTIPAKLTNYPIISNTNQVTIYSLNVASGASLTIKSDASGTGSLIVDGTSSGTLSFERYLTGYSGNADNGWHFLSLPISGLTISSSTFSPTSGTDDLYEFDESEDVNNWLNYDGGTFGDTEFQVGKGYLVAYENTSTKTFSGSTIRTSDLTVDLAYTDGKPFAGWNLVGNPFTSAIDWDEVTKTASVNGSVYVVNSADGLFKSWNGTTGDLTGGIIPANQGFFVHASATSQSITMAAGSAGDQVHNTTTYYKNTSDLADNTFKISISSENGSDNTYVQLREDATASFDEQIDAYKMYGFGELTEIYTIDDENKYSINCLPADLQAKQIRIGIKSTTETPTLLTFEGLNSLLEQYQISFEDVLTSQTFSVDEGFEYSFTSAEGDSPNRFLLHFGVVGIGEQNQTTTLNAYAYNNRLYINNSLEKAQLAVYDLQGRLLMQQSANASGLQSLPLDLPAGIYVVRLSNAQEAKSVKINVQ